MENLNFKINTKGLEMIYKSYCNYDAKLKGKHIVNLAYFWKEKLNILKQL